MKKILLSLGFFSATSFAQENPISKLSFDSGYLVDSSRAFFAFGQEVDGVVATSFDAINEWTFIGDFFLTRLALGGLYYWQWNKLEYGFFVSNHELGHGAQLRAMGSDPVYRWGTEPWIPNIFSFWAEGFNRYGQGAEASASDGLTSQYTPDDYLIRIVAGGMNNSTQYAEFIEDQISTGGGGHILQYLGYVRAKEDAASYVDNTSGGTVEGDVYNLLNEYAAKGYNISASEIKTGSLVSRWLSSTHWIFVASALKYLIKKDPTVNPVFLGNFRLPDISHFLTTRGLAYKIRTGIQGGDHYFPLSFETVYKGDPMVEVGIGIRPQFDKSKNGWGAEAFINSAGGFGLAGDYAVLQNQKWNFTLGTSVFSEKSLAGERRVGKYLTGGSLGYEVWTKLAYDY